MGCTGLVNEVTRTLKSIRAENQVTVNGAKAHRLQPPSWLR